MLLRARGDDLEVQYTHILTELGKRTGTLGRIFQKSQNKIRNAATLRKLIVDLIDTHNWSATGTDIKGDAYEALLERGAEDVKSGAGQYFTPRALISAMVDCMQPSPDDTIMDPAAGTGGFLLAAHQFIQDHHGTTLTREQRTRLASGAISGVELVDGTARLAQMNQQRDARLVEHVLQLMSAVGRVDLDQDRADLGRGVLDERPLGDVRGPDPDAVAGPDPRPEQSERQRVDAGDELGVGEAAAGRDVDEGLAVGVPGGGAVEAVPDRVAEQRDVGGAGGVRREGGGHGDSSERHVAQRTSCLRSRTGTTSGRAGFLVAAHTAS